MSYYDKMIKASFPPGGGIDAAPDIELPPLPAMDYKGEQGFLWGQTAMRDYAEAAVRIDRKRRS